MEEITDLFTQLLEQFRSVDLAEAEFKRMANDDPDLKGAYREWCDISGSTERNGFRDFCEEYIATQEQVWETLKDYSDE